MKVKYKIIYILIIFFLILGSLNSCVYKKEATAVSNLAGKIEKIDPYLWDFGQVQEGRVLQHTFKLKNDSPKVLNIKDASTSCGCAVSKVEKKVLFPGQSTSIAVQFNTKGYAGPVQQFIYVQTDNLDNPILRYIIKANVLKQ
jgi:hypothetical protein